MAKKKLTVRCEFGTFTRSTERPYEYVVVCQGDSVAHVEAYYQRDAAALKREIAGYVEVVEGRRSPLGQLSRDEYPDFLANCRENLKRLETEYPEKLAAAKSAATAYHVIGWSGSFKNACKMADGATWARNVRIVSVADGKAVR